MEHRHRKLLYPVNGGHKPKNTWLNLYDHFSSNLNIPIDFWYDGDRPSGSYKNSYYDPLFTRRFNVVTEEKRSPDKVRLLVLKSLLEVEPGYKRLCHHQGRPVWGYNLKYEGVSNNARVVSFTLKGESKRFYVPEHHVLYLEDNRFVSPQSYLFATSPRLPLGTFGSPLRSEKCLQNMFNNQDEYQAYDDFVAAVKEDNPITVGSLVTARMGTFCPDYRYRRTLITYLIDFYVEKTNKDQKLKSFLLKYYNDQWVKEGTVDEYKDFVTWCREDKDALFPLGLVIADEDRNYSEEKIKQGIKTYTVRFGQTIYEGVAPYQIEVVT